MKSIYKSEQGKNKVLELYSKQLNKLNCTYKNTFVDTSYGKTHIVEIENLDKPPLLVFHGGNSRTIEPHISHDRFCRRINSISKRQTNLFISIDSRK